MKTQFSDSTCQLLQGSAEFNNSQPSLEKPSQLPNVSIQLANDGSSSSNNNKNNNRRRNHIGTRLQYVCFIAAFLAVSMFALVIFVTFGQSKPFVQTTKSATTPTSSVPPQSSAMVPLIRIESVETSVAMLAQSINQSIDPCDDFYKFVCQHVIHPNSTTTRQLTMGEKISKLIDQSLFKILQSPPPPSSSLSDDEPVSLKNAKIFYKTCVVPNSGNETYLEQLKSTWEFPLVKAMLERLEIIKLSREITFNTRDAFIRLIQQSQWIPEELRLKIVERTKSMKLVIGIPEQLNENEQLMEQLYDELQMHGKTCNQMMEMATKFDIFDRFIRVKRKIPDQYVF